MPAPLLYRSAAVAAVTAMLLGSLAACKTETVAPTAEPLPLATGEAPPPGVAPAVEQLPPAPAVRYVPVAQPQQGYAYIDDAYEMDEAFDDAPPDYGFDYDGAQPWVWRTAADAWRLVEPAPDGDRYYFYEPGRSDPYLVRDASYSYAYSEGRLVNVYDSRGYVLDRIEAERRADRASRYYARARALRAAAAEDRRQQVIAAQWAQRQARIRQDRAQWRREQQQIGQWRAYHARYGEDRAKRLADERQHRRQQAASFRDWRARDYAGPPPRVVARQEQKRDWQFWKRQQRHDRQLAEQRHDDRHRQQVADQRQRAHDADVRRDRAARQAQAEAQARAEAQRQQQLRDQRARDQAQVKARTDAQRRQRDRAHAVAVAQQKRKDAHAPQAKAEQQKAAAQARASRAAKAKADAQAQARAEQKRKAAQAQAQAKTRQAAKATAHARSDKPHRPHGRRDDDRPAPSVARN